MYYLKHRPKTLSELDNSRVKEQLQKILESKQVPHAFLLIGQKGTGKTSTARIIAKSVNCLSNSFAEQKGSIEPCNKCANCMSIEQSSSPDVIELDAASNRGIDEIRSLIRESSFTPMTARYRVFIIDEAHMITHDAFNALLKTLEEPSASVIFILATTNSEKVPKTVISRCLTINFGKAKKLDVMKMLVKISQREKLTVSDDVLELIASHSEHSFRDAAKLLEELSIQQKTTLEDARNYLGIRSKSSLLETLQNGSLKDALLWIQEYNTVGGNVKYLIEEILNELESILLSKNGIETDETEQYTFTTSEIIQLMKLFTESYTLLRSSPVESIPLEIAVAEFYNRKQGS